MTMRFSWSQSRAPGMQSFDAGVFYNAALESLRLCECCNLTRSHLGIRFLSSLRSMTFEDILKMHICTSTDQPMTNPFASICLFSFAIQAAQSACRGRESGSLRLASKMGSAHYASYVDV